MKAEAEIRKLRDALAKIVAGGCHCRECEGHVCVLGGLVWVLGEGNSTIGDDDIQRWEEQIYAEAAKL